MSRLLRAPWRAEKNPHVRRARKPIRHYTDADVAVQPNLVTANAGNLEVARQQRVTKLAHRD
jgi:hypothetical protein